MSGTIISFCTCVSKYQDTAYGKNQRVHNIGKAKQPGAPPPIRCTVCGVQKTR